ncbi:hypothetical protein DFH08DRAFT_823934 [Mycena albidolilacea]|uniref:Uncharacterized protein n=1 Tax=Mycena albidolilacea TaxID=1033008 RepID=A0AAD7EAN8_9AGAR|nr:hypothetical protein DFH08DRAFT_823934 [Mycena albidolilacea]
MGHRAFNLTSNYDRDGVNIRKFGVTKHEKNVLESTTCTSKRMVPRDYNCEHQIDGNAPGVWFGNGEDIPTRYADRPPVRAVFGYHLTGLKGVFLRCLDHPLWDVPCFVFFAWDVPWVFWLGTYHPLQAERKNLWDVPWSHFECWTPGTSGPRKEHFCGHFWKKAGVAGGYSAQHGCTQVAGGILCSTVALRLQAAILCSTVSHGTVALGLQAVFRAARLRSGCGQLFRAARFRTARLRSGCRRYSARHGCAWVADGIPRLFREQGCAPVAGGVPRTVALGLRETVSSE